MFDIRLTVLTLANEYSGTAEETVNRAEAYLNFMNATAAAPAVQKPETPAAKPAAGKKKPAADTPASPAAVPSAAGVVPLKTYTDAFLALMSAHGREVGTNILKKYGVERASMVKESDRNAAYAEVQAAHLAGDAAKSKAASAASSDDSLI